MQVFKGNISYFVIHIFIKISLNFLLNHYLIKFINVPLIDINIFHDEIL